jgi:hypothetical protein
MNSRVIAGLLIFGFIVFITQRGELVRYMQVVGLK